MPFCDLPFFLGGMNIGLATVNSGMLAFFLYAFLMSSSLSSIFAWLGSTSMGYSLLSVCFLFTGVVSSNDGSL